jgi:hypothetical protein
MPSMILAALGIAVASPMLSAIIKGDVGTKAGDITVDLADDSQAKDKSGIGRFIDHAAVSLMSSIWSTVSRPRRAMADRAEWPITSPARTSPFSTNSAICRLHNQAASCSSI